LLIYDSISVFKSQYFFEFFCDERFNIFHNIFDMP